MTSYKVRLIPKNLWMYYLPIGTLIDFKYHEKQRRLVIIDVVTNPMNGEPYIQGYELNEGIDKRFSIPKIEEACIVREMTEKIMEKIKKNIQENQQKITPNS